MGRTNVLKIAIGAQKKGHWILLEGFMKGFTEGWHLVIVLY